MISKISSGMLALGLCMLVSCSQKPVEKESFPSVQDRRIVVDGVSSRFVGTNLWYAGRLASTEEGLERLRTELDTLKGLGVNNLRVLAVEGEDLGALRTALDEMQERGMYAVLFMNNTWEWSYGFAEYLERAGAGVQPRPKTEGYSAFMKAMAQFTTNAEAVVLNQEYVKKVVTEFKDHKAIFSWQLCNEPRCFSDDWATREAFIRYIHGTAALIKSIDPDHMVSTGSEGYNGCEQDMDFCRRVNDCKDIDYINIHIWPYNWGWAKEDNIAGSVDNAIAQTDKYIDMHLSMAARLGKPIVIEEFGYPRDGFQFTQGTPVTGRDRYYTHVFDRVVRSAREDGLIAGCNFWGWGGFAAQNPDSFWWQEGDDLCGDPAQEQQGLNSVYVSDASTIEVIKAANAALRDSLRLEVRMQHDWLYIGSTPRVLDVDVRAIEGTEVEVDFNLVADTTLMYTRDTVFSSTCTVVTGEKGIATASFSFDSIEPGFYQVNLSAEGLQYPTFNIGIEPEKIVSPTDRQPDFDEFWDKTLAELAAVPMNVKLTKDSAHSNDLRTSYTVEVDSWNGGKIGGYLCVPVKEGKYPTYIDYMGYGADPFWYDPSSNPEAVEFLVSVRDQGIFKGKQSGWINRGIESEYTQYYRGAFCDVVRAIDFICSLDKVDQNLLFSRGESQGGAFTLVSVALDHRIKAAAPAVPFLGDYEDYSRIVWWPMWEVFQTADKKGIAREDLFRTMSYFDVKNFCDRIECPIFMAFGLQDPTCPPHTNFSEYNLIGSEKHYLCVPRCGHGMWEIKEWAEKRQEWFNTFLK